VQRDDPPEHRPQLHVVALGINQYHDQQVRRLQYSVADAEAVARRLAAGAKGLYDLGDPVILSNDQVTPENWQHELEKLKSEIAERAAADDLLVVFLAGHGVMDPESRQYYYAGYRVRVADVSRRIYSDCLSWDHFETLANIPCRKLVLLDTCHSGAIQPLSSRQQKASSRWLHEHIIFTLAAAEGGKGAAERPDWGHGAFTKCLLDGLYGSADMSQDGLVSLRELTGYVAKSVEKITAGDQHPTYGPKGVLDHVILALTHAEQDAGPASQ
jgi:uncharacterized caspase-like protein